ncbi:LysR family transcriptional regulator [Cellulomonas sp. IC4_254]|uniref:helix-turn-helix domain-containing protein n=1 Tax=Cellulomonas sp. IC4_254 TaxID=2714040 RepID=UPI001422EF69|nr:LysR family transcriptional regulator [Cellulomonas sp. IC4_254]NHT19384.1 LysR family transcriptional regulator [Cellulomonas sp. IC4_254]
MVQLTHLATFVAVVEHGSMTTASAALPCAVSTVSTHVALLERRLDVRLLQRSADGCTPTPAGVVVARRAAEILALHTRMVAEARAGSATALPTQRDAPHPAAAGPGSAQSASGSAASSSATVASPGAASSSASPGARSANE